MALSIEHHMEDGSPITFHKVIGTQVDLLTGDGLATLGSWRSYEDFVLKKAPVLRRKYSFALNGMDSYMAAYESIKQRDEFDGAEEI